MLCCLPVMLNEDSWCLDKSFELERKFCKNFYIFGPTGYLSLPVTTTNGEVLSTNFSPDHNQVCLLPSHSKHLTLFTSPPKTLFRWQIINKTKTRTKRVLLQSKHQEMPCPTPSGESLLICSFCYFVQSQVLPVSHCLMVNRPFKNIVSGIYRSLK